MRRTALLLVLAISLLSASSALAEAHSAERDIWPDIKHCLKKKMETNLAGAGVVLARIMEVHKLRMLRAGETQKPPFISSKTLTQWKNGRYGITGLTPAEIEACRTTNNSHGPTDALQPDVNAQLTCYGIVVSRCMGMRIPEWSVLSKWFIQTDTDAWLEWAKRFVAARSACVSCPCAPPMPNGLLYAPAAAEPDIEAEILCIGAECKP